MKAAVFGAGAWGTAFSCVLAAHGHDATLVCRDPEQAREIGETGRNPRYLPNADLADVAATTSDDPTLADADLHVVAVPSHAFRAVAEALPGSGPVLSLTKGLDPETGGRLSELVQGREVAVLSGPNFAEEIAEGLPAAAVIASESEPLALELQQAIHSLAFRVYASGDVTGVELAWLRRTWWRSRRAASTGSSSGQRQGCAHRPRPRGDGAAGPEACGARPETFAGLAGMGDLIAHVLARARPQPTRGRANRARVDPGRGSRGDRNRGGPDHGSGPARSFPPGSGSSCPITEGVCQVLDGNDLGCLSRRPDGPTTDERMNVRTPALSLLCAVGLLVAGCGWPPGCLARVRRLAGQVGRACLRLGRHRPRLGPVEAGRRARSHRFPDREQSRSRSSTQAIEKHGVRLRGRPRARRSARRRTSAVVSARDQGHDARSSA